MTEHIGRYELQAELGRGGFGKVFRAYDPVVGRSVAIKILLATGDADLLKRFRNEAGATGKLRHRNIVVVHDFGDHEGQPYLVMELLEGQDLERIVAGRQPMSLLQKVDVISQMAAGLHHAHSRGIVHRDIKPANVMLLGDGTIKIMDFGIALLNQATSARITPQGSLIGTFPYMAPEQFHGALSDSVTDIFALGVTCYKFLTAIHPFNAPEMASVMFNIVNQTPESVRSLVPDCPEALENVVFRMLAKDRDNRYQSLEDALFDVEPIFVELRKERVQELVSRSRGLIEADELHQAQTLVREALDLEPGSPPARELREQLQHLIKEKTVRPQVAALIEAGRHYLETQSYDQAIHEFESALRLDKSNTLARQLIKDAQAAWEQRQRADRLVRDAQIALGTGDLTAAKKRVDDALSAAPEHEGAKKLLENVRRKLQVRDHENRLRDGLSKAKGLLLLESFDAAIDHLSALQNEFPDSEDVRSLLYDVMTERAARVRRENLQRATDEVKRLLKEQQFAEAVTVLSRLMPEYPESKELGSLLAYAQREERNRAEAAEIAYLSRESQRLIAGGSLEQAVEMLRAATTRYPLESSLRELLQTAESTRAERARADALDRTVAEVNQLLARQAFAKALEQIAAFTAAYDNSVVLDPLRRSAEEGLEKLKRVASIRKLMLEAQSLIDEGRPGTASKVLQEATVHFPGDLAIASLLSVAENRLREQREREQISRAISEAESFTRARRFDEALAALDQVIARYPNETRLRRCRQATVAAGNNWEQERAVTEAAEAATRFAAEAQFEPALELLSSTLAKLGGRPHLIKLKGDIESRFAAHKRKQALRETLSEAQELIEKGDARLATRLLGAIPADHVDAEVKTLLIKAEQCIREQDQAKEISRVAGEIAGLRNSGQLDKAYSVAQSALQSHPYSEHIQREFDLIQQLKLHRETLGQLLQTASSLAESGQFVRALEVLERSSSDLAKESSVVSLRNEISQEYSISTIVSQAEDLLAAGDWDASLVLVLEGLSKFPRQPQLSELRKRIEDDKASAERDRAISALVDDSRSLLDSGELESALKVLDDACARFPAEPRLADLQTRARRETEDRNRRRRIEDARIAAESAIQSGDFAKAIALIEAVSGGSQALEDLLSKARELQARKLHDDLLAQAYRLCEESRFEEALAAVKRAMVQFGESSESADLRTRLESETALLRRQQQREDAVRRLRELLLTSAMKRAGSKALKLAQREAHEIGNSHPTDAEITELAAKIEANTETSLSQVRKTRIGFGLTLAAGVTAAILGILSYKIATRSPVSVPVEIRTDPQGASVQIGSQSCVTPRCIVNLMPGQYQVKAKLDGYQPVRRNVDIRDSKALVMDLVLEPIPPAVPLPTSKGFGTLVLRASQPGALVLIDKVANERTDSHGDLKLRLPAEEHFVSIEKNGFHPSGEHRVAIEKDRTVSLQIDLVPDAPPRVEPSNDDAKAPPPTQTPIQKMPTQQELAEQDWQKAYASHDPAQLRAFMGRYPGDAHASEAQSALDDSDWSHVNTSDQQSLTNYASQYPSGRHVQEAKLRMADLAWMTLDKSNEQTIKQYLRQYPDGGHRLEAENLITSIEAQLAAANQKPASAPKEQRPRLAEKERFGIASALAQFNQAFKRKQPKDVKRIWPGVRPQDTDAMRLPGTTYLMALEPTDEAEVSGETASVNCDLLVTTTVNGKTDQSRKQVKVRLQKSRDMWLIVDPLGS